MGLISRVSSRTYRSKKLVQKFMSNATYGGEDVSALVFDIGSHTCRVGYGGDFEPKLIYPSVVGLYYKQTNDPAQQNTMQETDQPTYLVGKAQLTLPLENVEIHRPIDKDGIIKNFTIVEHLIKFAYKQLHLKSSEHPVILSEPAWNDSESRQKLANLFFKKFNVPALQIIKSPILALFSQGKATGMVVDIGHKTVSTTPVVNGIVLKQGVLRNLFAGEFIINRCRDWLKEPDLFPPESHQHFWPLVLPYEIKSKKSVIDGKSRFDYKEGIKEKKLTNSWRLLQEDFFLEDLVKHVIKVADKDIRDYEHSSFSNHHYEFPNGYQVDFSQRRFEIAEYMFDPSPLDPIVSSMLGIVNLMTKSSRMCDGDSRQQLLQNIHLVGGGSCINGMVDRMNYEINSKIGNKIKLVQPLTYCTSGVIHQKPPYSNNERRFATWIGGSILASLGSFHNMWITSSEWDENGTG